MKDITIDIKEMFHKVWKAVCIIGGIILLANGIFVLTVSNMNIGIVATLGLGVVFLFYGLYLDWVLRKVSKWIRRTFFSGVSVVIIFVVFLLIYGSVDNATYKEDAVIVLGCGIRGEEPSESLKRRLDSAIDYYQNNPDAIIVVSGGQGHQENITEALAMEKYLIDKGIPQDKIIKEEKSTSTYENFMYSKQVLDEYFGDSYTVVYITNEYHIYRAAAIAKSIGLEDVKHCSGATPWYMVISNCLRECVGVAKYWVLGN